MRVAKNAPRGPFYVLDRLHGLAEIVECGAGVEKESLRVIPPHPDGRYADEGASLDELRQAISMYEDLIRRARRIFGDSHPAAESMAARLEEARVTLARRTQS